MPFRFKLTKTFGNFNTEITDKLLNMNNQVKI